MDKQKMITIGCILIGLYLFYPNYEKHVPFMGMNPAFWMLLPLLIGIIAYQLYKKRSWIETIMAREKETFIELEDPYKQLTEFENSRERSIIPGRFKIMNYIKGDNEWIFSIIHGGQKKYLILNGMKDQKLNPTVVTNFELRELGFNNIKDYKRTGKSRLYYDLLSLNPDIRMDELKNLD